MQKVIINATNIGHKLDGIGVYTLNLLIELSKLNTGINFIVFLNRNCEQHIRGLKFPDNFSIRWVKHLVSPDYGFRGHFLRLLYSNLLSLRYRKSMLFNTSQLEAMFFRTKQIICIQDIIPLLFKKDHKKQFFFYRYILKHALNSAKHIITTSNHTRELVLSFYKLSNDKLHVIHLGIQDIYIKEAETCNQERENFILYAGRIAPTKNVIGILKAFELIKEKLDYKLIIAGSGKENIKEKSYIDNDRVLFKGYISNNEMLRLYRKALLFVFPSFYEGFGLPPLEAMACGCPVVVSNVASLPEVCGDAAYYVNPYNIESIAEGMYKVLTDESLRRSLIQKGLERAKLFSWEKSAKEHLEVFKEVLNS